MNKREILSSTAIRDFIGPVPPVYVPLWQFETEPILARNGGHHRYITAADLTEMEQDCVRVARLMALQDKLRCDIRDITGLEDKS